MPEQQFALSPRHGWPTSMQPYWLKTSGGISTGGATSGGLWGGFGVCFLP
jgi:hypothetical protein